MLRNGENWDLDEPEENEDGVPIIHDLARILGCIREPQDTVWLSLQNLTGATETIEETNSTPSDEMEDEGMACSGEKCVSLELHGSSLSETQFESVFTPMDTAMAHSLIQQQPYSLVPTISEQIIYQPLQQGPKIILRDSLTPEALVIESNSPLFSTEQELNAQYQHQRLCEDTFGSRDTADCLIPERSPETLDWSSWTDVLASETFLGL